MRKLCGLLALVLALGVLASNGISPADAQDKAKTKKTKDTKAAKDAAGTIEIYKGKDGFRFRIKDGEGKSLAISTRARETRAEVVDDLDTIKTTLGKAKPMDVE